MIPADLPREERTPCEIWTRVMGYHRPVSAFNLGKRAEHIERQYFCEVPTSYRQPGKKGQGGLDSGKHV
jgi:hypothetical protein